MALTPDEMHDAIIANLPAKTGHSLEEWVARLKQHGPTGEKKDRVKWLVSHHGLGTITANFVVGYADRPEDYKPAPPDALLDGQYAGSRAPLRPIYDRLEEVVRENCPEALIEPRKTYVSLRVKYQFGIIQPTTVQSLDLGLKLPPDFSHPRVEPAGKWNDQVTHRIRLKTADEVDNEVVHLLRTAFENRKR